MFTFDTSHVVIPPQRIRWQHPSLILLNDPPVTLRKTGETLPPSSGFVSATDFAVSKLV